MDAIELVSCKPGLRRFWHSRIYPSPRRFVLESWMFVFLLTQRSITAQNLWLKLHSTSPRTFIQERIPCPLSKLIPCASSIHPFHIPPISALPQQHKAQNPSQRESHEHQPMPPLFYMLWIPVNVLICFNWSHPFALPEIGSSFRMGGKLPSCVSCNMIVITCPKLPWNHAFLALLC